MAKITRLGQLGSTGISSGPHLHGYVLNLQTNQYEDPGIHRSKFLGVRVGPNRVPKYIADEIQALLVLAHTTGVEIMLVQKGLRFL
jgi:murein DD-endopeptidase MepM/ murein hydrolase activator NlpD